MTSVSQRLIKGGIIALVGKTAVAVGVVLVNALVARLLSPEQTGLFLLALSMVTVAAVIADFGFGKTLVRVIPDALSAGDNVRALSHIRHVFLFSIFTISMTALVLIGPPGIWLAGVLSHGELLGSLMPLVALWLAITVTMSLLAETCRGFHHIGEAIFFGGALNGLGNIIVVSAVLSVILLTAAPLSLGQLILLFIGSGALLSLLAMVRLIRRYRRHHRDGDRVALSGVFSMAWPFWVSNMALILLTQAEIWILGLLRPPEEVAAFGLVARLALLVSFPLVIVNSVLPPLISELYARDDITRMERMLRGSASITTFCSLLIFLPLLVLGDWLPGVIFGDYFVGNWDIMMVLALGWLFHVWAGSGGFVLNMTDNQKSLMKINIVVGLFTIAAGFYLTYHYGGLGMAVASSSGLVVINVLMLYKIRRKLGMHIYAGLSGLQDVTTELARRLRAQGGAEQ